VYHKHFTNTNSLLFSQICLSTQGEECAASLIAAYELRSQKGLSKTSPNKNAPFVFPMSIDSCSLVITSIAEGANSSIESVTSSKSIFEVHEAEIAGKQNHEKEEYTAQQHGENEQYMEAVSSTCSKLHVTSPYSSFKLDSTFRSSDYPYQPISSIIPFRFTLKS
jgi:hypothetical protein